jgi:hypothetical protein
LNFCAIFLSINIFCLQIYNFSFILNFYSTFLIILNSYFILANKKNRIDVADGTELQIWPQQHTVEPTHRRPFNFLPTYWQPTSPPQRLLWPDEQLLAIWSPRVAFWAAVLISLFLNNFFL